MSARRQEIGDILERSLFFGICGAGMGLVVGGVVGLAKGIPLRRTLPITSFKSAAFLGTISAVQGTLELIREVKDAWNPLIAGGWTGFVFGRSLAKMGLVGAVNGAALNWIMQSITISSLKAQVISLSDSLNPLASADEHAQLSLRISALKEEIAKLSTSTK